MITLTTTTLSFNLLLSSLLCSFHASLAADFLSLGQTITGTESFIVSSGQNFVLGFFSPSNNESYLGIWYNTDKFPGNQTVVWVANRDNPVVGSTGVFRIATDGNMEVRSTSGGTLLWSTGLEGSSSSKRRRIVKLLDSGNLVLKDDDQDQDGNGNIIWKSFEHPTDTFLPGMKMDQNLKLTSWINGNNPGTGNYSFVKTSTEDNPVAIMRGSIHIHWQGVRNLNLGPSFKSVDYLLRNFTGSTDKDLKDCPPKVSICDKPYSNDKKYENTRLVMTYNGQIQLLSWNNFKQLWTVDWEEPATSCDKHRFCGHFTKCTPHDNNNNNDDNGNDNDGGGNKRYCKCLPGFSQTADKDCVRKSGSSWLCREGSTTFLNIGLIKMKLATPYDKYPADNESECKRMCLKMCSQCQAYSYAATAVNNPGFSNSPCLIWKEDLDTIQEEYSDDGKDDDNNNDALKLFIRVYKSDIEPTPRCCDPCGTKMVPYPLSTEPNCGDPKYYNFSCNKETGQLSFIATSSSSLRDNYTVSSIVVDSKKFVISVNSSDTDCDTLRRAIGHPFNVSKDCSDDEDKVEVTWQPPPEPLCNEFAECERWINNSSCQKTKEGTKRCLCDSHYIWNGDYLNCTQQVHRKGTKATWLVVGITLTSMFILACAIIVAYVYRRKITLKKEKKTNQRDRKVFKDSVRHVKELIEAEGLEEDDHEGIGVPYFDFKSLLVATDNFSDANKLGKGGYGPVYKGKLQSGEVVAVKRLSSVSSQGLQEFKNEVVLIAKLQHRNLVRLRGYCIKGNEKILLYEYMHNRSLDSFVFDPTKSALLDWQMRFDIIVGVARGILYLHQDSRLRVIHRDLKTSNILLDEEMQPKISDFGLAKIVEGKENEANTTRVVGTYGYMSPEYALDGLFSTKSDIFSFGVVLLEVISGKRNTRFYNSEQFSSLLIYAWTLYTENRLLDLMDMYLGESCNTIQFIRCAHIGLLCVQDEPSDRPTMSNVVTMLDSETSILPIPKEPTYFGNRGQSLTTTSSKPEISTQFESSSKEVEY